MGFEDRLVRLEQDIGVEPGPPPQAYIDARNRRGLYMRLGLGEGLGQALSEEERAFLEEYRGSDQDAQDSRIIKRYSPPPDPAKATEARARMKEILDAIADRRRRLGI